MSERIILSRSKGHNPDKSGNIRSEKRKKKQTNEEAKKEKVKASHGDFQRRSKEIADEMTHAYKDLRQRCLKRIKSHLISG